ncbi:hypothetical protein OAO55_00705 [Bacteroidales bacterium]|nr:hypothetical protein [Bacteroidales bacterium]
MKKICIYSLLILFNVFGVKAAAGFLYHEESKLVRSFYAGQQTQLEVNNKYGTVQVNTWDKDSVKFIITTTLKAEESEIFQKLKSSIDFEFINTKYYVVARSMFSSSSNAFYRAIQDAFKNDGAISVNWDIYVPETCKLKIENKYGGLYAGNLNGVLDFNIEHGDFKANDIKGELKLEANFAEIDINSVEHGRLLINYSTISLSKGNVLDIESKTSELDISDVAEIKIKGKRDKYYLNNIKTVDIQSFFCKIDAKNIEKKFFGSLRYGSLDLIVKEQALEILNITSNSADTKINLESFPLNYNLKINHKKTRIILPNDIIGLKDERINEKDEIYYLTGYKGDAIKKTEIKCNLSNCEFSLFER